ncbi:RagB/SusD family nutrient uptake outer membrane protein [Hufsiella ginkgonis]|uniref:RagB/SusD family nutrient uptake outer membrane protein n=1 Tax=Hufsiella ginkgonis TaxID=2695274 RepID=A0A7K1Y1H1_9SPHI|nr:RagB/SusD family nutrient uptake outer membrane protein [Hufsiella ginkgonis]MXV17094.1 RagB/SusD family nutrient uptake outer membrane protein [Hufsiella ginkgonis]
MKNKLAYIAAFTLGIQVLAGCKDYLEVNPRERVLVSNYYSTPEQAYASLVSVYDIFGSQAGGYYAKFSIMNVAADDNLAGGDSPSDFGDFQTVNTYTFTPSSGNGCSAYLWSKGFTGAFRANTFLQKIGGINMDANLKKRYVAEAKTLRAIFYFDLVRFFKNIPLILEPIETEKMYDVTQVAPAEVYKQIEKDLSEAMADLPATVPAATEGGRITQGAAHAVLGKVYLWQNKYGPAAAELALVNGPTPGAVNPTYGYKLLANFADLWNVKNKFNTESVLEIVYNSTSNAGWGNYSSGSGEGNVIGIIVGPRNYIALKPAQAPDYVSGWSTQPFTQEFFDLIHYDPRNKPTVANLDSLEKAGIVSYKHAYQNTGYFIEKFAGRVSTKAASGQLELNFQQDIYEIRLADTYMLEAEALMQSGASVAAGSRAYQLLNAVRARVGLGPVAVTLDNIMKERRIELAAEGHRWLDLVRWGKAASVLAFKGFVAGKNEIFPVPQNEMNNTKLQQSKEWGGTL